MRTLLEQSAHASAHALLAKCARFLGEVRTLYRGSAHARCARTVRVADVVVVVVADVELCFLIIK